MAPIHWVEWDYSPTTSRTGDLKVKMSEAERGNEEGGK